MIEIERKFLVKNLNFVKYGIPSRIKQGYIDTPKGAIRVRIRDNKALLTLKSEAIGFSRYEFEYEIPMEDAEIMLKEMCIQPIIDKVRFTLLHKGKKWEIDIFNKENEGLIIAEIELDDVNEKIIKPPFISKEVTEDKRFYNSYIAMHPFCEWEDKSCALDSFIL